jgi:hypothetical protein
MILTGGKWFYNSDFTEWQQAQGPDIRDSPSELGRILSVLAMQKTGPALALAHFIYVRQTTYLIMMQGWLGGRRSIKLPKGAEEWTTMWVPVYGKAIAAVFPRGSMTLFVVRPHPEKDRHHGYLLPECIRRDWDEAVQCVRRGVERLHSKSPVPRWFLGFGVPLYVSENRRPSPRGVLYDAMLTAVRDQFPNEALLAEML